MIRRTIGHCLAGITFIAGVASVARADALDQGFVTPPASNRPAVFGWIWQWKYPKEVLTRDLEEMKAQGITSCLLYYNCGLSVNRKGQKVEYGETENRIVPTDEYDGPGASTAPEMGPPSAKPWSAPWLETVKHLAAEAARLKIDLGVTTGPAGCYRETLSDEYGAQKLVYSATAVKGGARVEIDLPLSEKVLLQKGKKSPRFYRDIAVLAVPAQGTIAPESVVDLTGKMDARGKLAWDAPTGEWSVLRLGHSTTGTWALDHLSAEAFDRRWEQTILPLIRDMNDAERAGLRFIECDSYEGGAETWTTRFPEEFRQRRGYDILSWLPVLAGHVVGDKGQSARFDRDYRLTISDLFADNHYARHAARAKESGLQFYAEAAGPWQSQTDVLKSLARCDVAMGEFWMPGGHRGTGDSRRFLLRDAAAAAHGYGKGEVFCEAFTGGFDAWQESPFRMKPCADQAYCDGLTRPCIHGYSLSPWTDGEPGVVYAVGEYVNRHVTWWNQSHAFFDYLARCSFMSRQGVFAADVAVFTGESIGIQMPRKESWDALIQPNSRVRGAHDYDHMNSEILLKRMSVSDGRIVLPDGLAYRLLVLEKCDALSLPVLRKMAEMVEAGATISGLPPREPFGHKDDPAEFASLISRLWGAESSEKSGEHVLGKGKVVWGTPVLQVLADMGVTPDFECRGVSPKGRIDWIHRKTADGDIYYVASLWQPVEQIECMFRTSGKVPELWDPVTGVMREAGNFRIENGRTIVPLRLDPCGSTFVVFRKPTGQTSRNGKNWYDHRLLQQIDGSWAVRFNPAWFYPKPSGIEDARMVFEKLDDWTRHSEPAVKYFSGRAVYEKEFSITNLPSQGRVFLDLGSVGTLADVCVNGHDLGVLWTPPFRVDVTDAVKTGVNHLEIGVVNLWPNRLTGDTFLPEAQRRTRTNMTKYTQSSKLIPSGLLGPVRVMVGE